MSTGPGHVERSILEILRESGEPMTAADLAPGIAGVHSQAIRHAMWTLRRKDAVRLSTGPLTVWLPGNLPVKPPIKSPRAVPKATPRLPVAPALSASRAGAISNSASPYPAPAFLPLFGAESRKVTGSPLPRSARNDVPPEPRKIAMRAAPMAPCHIPQPPAIPTPLQVPLPRSARNDVPVPEPRERARAASKLPGKLPTDFENARLIAPAALYAPRGLAPPAMTLEAAVAILSASAQPAPPSPEPPPPPAPKASDLLMEAGWAALKLFGSAASPAFASHMPESKAATKE